MINLKKLIKEKNKTQKEISKDLKIPATTLNGYVKNKNTPPEKIIIKLANYFKVSIDYLFGREEQSKIDLTSLNEYQVETILLISKMDYIDVIKAHAYISGLSDKKVEITQEEIKKRITKL